MKATLIALGLCGAACAVLANPTGPTTVSGATLLSNPSSSVLQIVNTPGSIINWSGFSIAAGETTRFVQDSASSAVLNRVTGTSRSDILGTLQSNGRVFLINQNGIVFGGSSVVDVAGLIASTRTISDANFLAGNYLFDGGGSGTIAVQAGARISTGTYAPSGGQVWLFAKDVTQEAGSSITVPQGQVVLAAGAQVQVGTTALGNMSFTVTTDGSNTIDSLGSIAANQGAVGLFADYVSHKGTVEATNGTVALHGGARVETIQQAVINADGANGRISVRSNDLRIWPSGNVHAAGGDVALEQYAPSQWAVDRRSAAFFPKEGVVAPLENGDFLSRYSDSITPCGSSFCYEIKEAVLDANGNLKSGPTIVSVSPTSISTAGLSLYYGSTLQLRLYLSAGGWIERDSITGKINFYNSDGSLRGQIPHRDGYATPLWDGTIARPTADTVNHKVELFSASGAVLGSINSDLYDGGPRYPTRDGLIMFDMLWSGGSSRFIERWTKQVPAYAPNATPVAGDAGVAPQFALRPGVSPGDFYAPPPAPAPPAPGSGSGGGGGASFGGVVGCNFAVCSEIEKLSIAIIDSMRAGGAVPVAPAAGSGGDAAGPGSGLPGGNIDDEAAATAVRSLAAAAGRPNAITPEGARQIAIYMRDDGGLKRLVQGSRFDKLTPTERLERIEKWLIAEATSQAIGEDANASRSQIIDGVTFANAVANMNTDEKMAAGAKLAQMQAEGTLDSLSDALP